MATIDEKMAKMRLKNLELLKRHQEIEEDRQRAEQSGATRNFVIESTTNRMRKNRIRPPPMYHGTNQEQQSSESTRRRSTALRRKLENTGQTVDLNQADPDEATNAKKRFVVNNQVDRIGSGRFSQIQRKQGDGKLIERMRRCPIQNSDSMILNHEFHLDLPSIPMWQNHSISPVQLQMLSANGEPIDHSAYLHQNYLFSPSNPPNTLNNNGTIYFVPSPYQPTRNFDNQSRPPTTFHQFPAHSQTHFVRPANNKPDESSTNHSARFQSSSSNTQQRYPRHHQTATATTATLPLSAYMNVEDSTTSYQKQRRSYPTKNYHHEKHQFPLSSYDPRQYGFHNNQSRNNIHRRQQNINRRSNDEKVVEEWWTDNSTTRFIDKNTSDDKTQDQLLKSIDHLQQQLNLEEALDDCLTKANAVDSVKKSGTYNTAHFLQWAKKTFREELAGRLTAQEIEQHDAVTEDLEYNENETQCVDQLPTDFEKKLSIDQNRSTS